MTLLEILKSFYEVNTAHFKNLKEKSKIAHLSDIHASELYDIVHEKSSPVFVLSTGRCGTKLLTEILGENKNADVYHEPLPEFTWHNKYAFEHYKDHSDEVKMLFDGARYELIRNAYLNNNIFIETNNRVTFFAYQIAELYPKAKFVHLIRDPYEFVKSGLSRNWYSGKEIYDEGRITDFEHPEIWKNYSSTQKIARLWKMTNGFIDDFKIQHEVLTITSDELFTDADKVNSLIDYMGLNKMTESKLRKHISKPVNKSKNKSKLTEKQLTEIKEIV